MNWKLFGILLGIWVLLTVWYKLSVKDSWSQLIAWYAISIFVGILIGLAV